MINVRTIPISIIVPFYKEIYNLEKCCKAISRQTVSPYEVIIINDNPHLNLDKIKNFYKFKVLDNYENKGPAYSRNRGASNALGDILFFVDSDVIILKNAVEEVYNSFFNTGADIVQGVYVNLKKRRNIITRYMDLYNEYKLQKIKSLTSVASFCFAIKKDRFEQAGGFDINIQNPSVEDNDLSLRIHTLKLKIFLNRNLKCIHIKEYNSLMELLKRNFNMLHDMCKLYLRKKLNPIDASAVGIGKKYEKFRLLSSMVLASSSFFSLLIAFAFPLFYYYFIILFSCYLFLNVNFFLFILRFVKLSELFICMYINFLNDISKLFGILTGLITYLNKRY